MNTVENKNSKHPVRPVNPYESFLAGPTQKHWQRIGIQKRAGVATPLFSIYSRSSAGIGEFPDLKLLVDWCVKTGNSLIQLLPLNDVGFKFTPYDAVSTLALEPMYLSLEHLAGVDSAAFQKEICEIKKRYPAGRGRVPAPMRRYSKNAPEMDSPGRVDYGIKKAKLDLLKKIFSSVRKQSAPAFENYCRAQQFWLEDYGLFKVIKEERREACWEGWDEKLRLRNQDALEPFKKNHDEALEFQHWLQWQAFEQFREVKQYASSRNVLLMGDLPFLVSRDSADVWAHQSYFKLDKTAGAPPDAFFATGQRWGMPPYHWDAIAAHGYDYLIAKLRYAEHFYDCFRIDHAVGLFRIWTIALSEPFENGGLNGQFNPPDEKVWEAHGRKLLDVILANTRMLPCAEDLGVIPECSFRVLKEYGIPGMDIQRWMRDWGKTYDFKAGDQYRENSIAVVSTHDMSSLRGWWHFEMGTLDETLFQRHCKFKGIDFAAVKTLLFDPARSSHGRLYWHRQVCDVRALLAILKISGEEAWWFIDAYKGTYHEEAQFLNYVYAKNRKRENSMAGFTQRAIDKSNRTASIFSIQLLQDWLSSDSNYECDDWDFRINVPGTISDKNWSIVMPWSLEAMLERSVNSVIRTLNKQAKRLSVS